MWSLAAPHSEASKRSSGLPDHPVGTATPTVLEGQSTPPNLMFFGFVIAVNQNSLGFLNCKILSLKAIFQSLSFLEWNANQKGTRNYEKERSDNAERADARRSYSPSLEGKGRSREDLAPMWDNLSGVMAFMAATRGSKVFATIGKTKVKDSIAD